MERTLRVFLDSDVLISSALSKTSASYYLLHKYPSIQYLITDFSIEEIEDVLQKKAIENIEFQRIVHTKLETQKLRKSESVKVEYKNYAYDENDAHVVAGAKQMEAHFLLTFNLKDFNSNLLRKDFNIHVLTPGRFLQYLRSISS